MTRNLYHRVILFSALEYIQKQVDNPETYRVDEMKLILGRLKAYQSFRRFSVEEAKELAQIGSQESFQKVKEIQVDFSMYSIALLYEWIKITPKKERPKLMLSDSKITSLYAGLIKDMLGLKLRSTEYDRVKHIVDESKLTAKRFIHLLDNEVTK